MKGIEMTQYTWRPIQSPDIEQVSKLAISQLTSEIDEIFNVDQNECNYSITTSVVNQFFSPLTEIFSVAVDKDNNIVAFTSATTSEKSLWSHDKILTIKIAHVDKNLPKRQAITLINDMFKIWENFAKLSHSNIILSNTMRKNQSTFLKLHSQNGYVVRGSFAYKKLF